MVKLKIVLIRYLLISSSEEQGPKFLSLNVVLTHFFIITPNTVDSG